MVEEVGARGRTGKTKSKKVRQLDYYTGEEIEVYPSIKDAAYDNYVDPVTLSRYLRDKKGLVDYKKLRFEYVR